MITVVHTVVWIGVGWLVAMCLALAFAMPLCIVAKRATIAEELDLDLDWALDRLREVRAPSGQPFFATPLAREELLDELQELVLLGR